MTSPTKSLQADPHEITIRRCRRCGEVAGSKTGFGPWCEGAGRTHEGEWITVKLPDALQARVKS